VVRTLRTAPLSRLTVLRQEEEGIMNEKRLQSPVYKAVAYSLFILASAVIVGFVASATYILVVTRLTGRYSPPDKVANLLQTMEAWLRIGAVQASVGLVVALAVSWFRTAFSVRRALEVAALIPIVSLAVGLGFLFLTEGPYPFGFAGFLTGASVVAFLLSVVLLPLLARRDGVARQSAQTQEG
jgi:hypothetical protein